MISQLYVVDVLFIAGGFTGHRGRVHGRDHNPPQVNILCLYFFYSSQPINQSINQPINHPINQPSNQSIKQSINQ